MKEHIISLLSRHVTCETRTNNFSQNSKIVPTYELLKQRVFTKLSVLHKCSVQHMWQCQDEWCVHQLSPAKDNNFVIHLFPDEQLLSSIVIIKWLFMYK